MELEHLSHLQGLYLNGNQMTGEIPSGLGQLSQLEWVSLDHNELAGEVSSELGQLSACGGCPSITTGFLARSHRSSANYPDCSGCLSTATN